MAIRGKVQNLIIILTVEVFFLILGSTFIWLAFKTEHGLLNFTEYISIAAFYFFASASIITFVVTMLCYNHVLS